MTDYWTESSITKYYENKIRLQPCLRQGPSFTSFGYQKVLLKCTITLNQPIESAFGRRLLNESTREKPLCTEENVSWTQYARD